MAESLVSKLDRNQTVSTIRIGLQILWLKHTPPLFRARIWSMVLSLLRCVDCEKDRSCACELMAASLVCAEILFGPSRHCVRAPLVVREGATGFLLHEANVRRPIRDIAQLSMLLAAPSALLYGADMAMALLGGIRRDLVAYRGVERCVRPFQKFHL
jgi:hypothetical protein